MDYDHLTHLRRHHPTWRLLANDQAPFVVAFLHRAFIKPNVRTIGEQTLASHLDDYLYHLRGLLGENTFPRPALEYLSRWSDEEHGWLRRFYPASSDEPHFDLTPASELAIQWLASLERPRRFVGAESRLKVVFDLLRQIAEGSETDPSVRLRELDRRRDVLEAEIERVRAGTFSIMNDTQLKERFLQAAETAQALLADFRQVEQNFRELDRQVRERIATWEGAKGDVLETIFGERDAITDSDQGRSFRAFWDFLMSPARQEELTVLLERILALAPVAELAPDPRLKRVHYDWLTAGEETQRTVAKLSEQLRRYLDDQAWHEDRRIMTVIRELEQTALAVRNDPPPAAVMELDEASPSVELPMNRSLFAPPVKPVIARHALDYGDADVDANLLFEQFYVDKERLRARLRQALQTRRQIGLVELLESHPLEQGLAELVAWLSLATGEGYGVIDEHRTQQVTWVDSTGRRRQATLPTVIFAAGHRAAGGGAAR
jgi:flagellar motility protein MotE (MotC chaperone)